MLSTNGKPTLIQSLFVANAAKIILTLQWLLTQNIHLFILSIIKRGKNCSYIRITKMLVGKETLLLWIRVSTCCHRHLYIEKISKTMILHNS